MSIDASFVAGFCLGAVTVVGLLLTLALTECPTRTKEHHHD